MYGQIYKMQLNNYVYIGAHKGDIYKDDYFGSGIRWINILNKYGKENVQRVVLCECVSKQDMDEKEKHYIQLARDEFGDACVNIADGGQGGDLGEQVRKKLSDKLSGENNPMYGKTLSIESKKLISNKLKGHPNYNKKGYKHTEEAKKNMSLKNKGKKLSQDTIQKIRDARRNQRNLNLIGSKGKKWYYNPNNSVERVMCVEGSQPNGWINGKPQEKTIGKYYTNGEYDIFVKDGDVCPTGFYLGRHARQEYTPQRNKLISEKLLSVPKTQQHKDKLSEHFKGRRWYNNGVEQKQLFECPQGWVHGRIKTK